METLPHGITPADLPPEPTGGRILVVDDLDASALILRRLLEREGHHVSVTTESRRVIAMVETLHPDIVFLDVMMPPPNGIELCRALKQSPKTAHVAVILVTGLHDGLNRVAGLEAGADDFITKPVNPPQVYARVKSLLRQKRRIDDESAEALVFSLAHTVEARRPSAQGHGERTASYAVALGRTLGLDDRDLWILRRAGLLHDVGKVGLPDAILLKRGALTRDEQQLMQYHPIIGERLCGDVRSLAAVRPIIRYHHERQDGSGYPDRLRGDAIPLLASIVGVVDEFDSLTTTRRDGPVLSVDAAMDHLRKEARRGRHRTHLVETFSQVLERERQSSASPSDEPMPVRALAR